MIIKIYKSKEKLYISITGKIVLEECDRIKTSVLPFIDRGLNQIYVDLEQVVFIDSAGLGVLVGLKMTANKNKARLILSNPSRGVYDVLNVSKLDNIFDIITGKDAEMPKLTLMNEENLIKEISDEMAEEKPQVSPKIPQKPVIQQPNEPPPPPVSSPIIQMQPPPQIQEPQKIKAAESAKDGKSPQDLIDEYCRNAVEFMRQGYYEKAVEEYKKSLDVNPEYLPALNNLAIVYEKKPSWNSKAIEQWEKVLQISTRDNDPKHMDRATKHLENLRKMV